MLHRCWCTFSKEQRTTSFLRAGRLKLIRDSAIRSHMVMHVFCTHLSRHRQKCQCSAGCGGNGRLWLHGLGCPRARVSLPLSFVMSLSRNRVEDVRCSRFRRFRKCKQCIAIAIDVSKRNLYCCLRSELYCSTGGGCG